LPNWIEVHVGDVINYQIEYSVPKYGLDSNHSHRISKETMYTSICQMMNVLMTAMDQSPMHQSSTISLAPSCFHKSAAELRNNTRLLTHWSGCPICPDLNTTNVFSKITHSKFEQIACKMNIDGMGMKTTRTKESSPKHKTLTRGTARSTSKQILQINGISVCAQLLFYFYITQ
ncbi:unnamed protein product, partial [Fasciola hepatica]